MADLQTPRPYIEEDDIPSQIVHMILVRMRDHLSVALQDEISHTDPTRAIIVKVGRFQDNPVKKNVNVSISGGDFEDPSYMDARVDHSSLDQFQLKNLPVGEIGGGTYWWRRFTTNYQTFYVKQRLPEENAMKYAYEFYGRMLKATELCTFYKFTDYYGEKTCSTPYIEGTTLFESGGAQQYIWRGKVKWRVLTWRP